MIDHQLHARSRPAARLSAADRRDLAQAWNVYPEDPAGSSATAARCLDKAREAGDSEIAAEALAVQAAIAIGGGDLKTGERLVDEARTAQASDPYLRPSTQIATVSALLAFQTGAFARAITEIARAIELADRSGDLDLRIQARRVACAVNGNLGLRGLRRPIEEVLSLTIAAGDKAEEAISRSDLATALWWDGELDKAEEQVERALALIEPLLDGHRISSAAILGTRGEIRLAAGRAEEGLADIETALERLERHASPNPYLLAEFTCSRLAALVELDRVDEARDVGSEILARLGDRVPQGRRRIMAQVAKALRESGHAEEAYDLLIDAAELQRLEFEELRSQLH
ncbi:MAG: tetratricopeptide repeat protein, partial [Solirubrobacterales bacterium]|nr:tetratricopeptide repeat protein [Solirubrobacterales bacterium]